MRRAAPVLLVAVALVTAGCTGPSGSGDTLGVEYVVRADHLPEEVRSVNVSFRVVFVSTPADFGPCYPEIFRNRYDPTPTPLSDPSGACYAYGEGHRGGPIEVNLTGTAQHSLGEFAGPPWAAGGHALLVTNVTVIRDDGTRVTDVWDTGFEVLTSTSRTNRTYGIELAVERAPDEDYEYEVSADRFDPTSGQETNAAAVRRRE